MKPRVGVIGGGQLARMMIVPAVNLGIELKVLAEAQDSSAALATTAVGDYNLFETVAEFAKTVDVITFDHEHVPLDVARLIATPTVHCGIVGLMLPEGPRDALTRREVHERVADPELQRRVV